MGRTVNPLSFDFRGSNPLLPTFTLVAFPPDAVRFAESSLRDEYIGPGRMSSGADPGICGSSSFGRAIAFQAIGGEFEPRLPLKVSQESEIIQLV